MIIGVKSFTKNRKVAILLVTAVFLINTAISVRIVAALPSNFLSSSKSEELLTIQNNSVSANVNPSLPALPSRKIKMVITAYSSAVWQTDNTPFITASGTLVREGLVANNLLPLGTKVKIPEIYGDKVFMVEDRMNRRKGYYHLDIWFPEYTQAKNFGVKTSYIEVLES